MPSKAAAQHPHIVAIGSSAGGIKPLGELLEALGKPPELCLVIAQHLAQTRTSTLVQMLQRNTEMKVRTIADGDVLEGGSVYITPPGADVVYRGGQLRLLPPKPRISPFPSVDDLFESLAADPQAGPCVAVILSGMGADGARGVRAISEAGGVVMVQNLSDASSSGMPESALSSGSVDLSSSVQTIGKRLLPVSRALNSAIPALSPAEVESLYGLTKSVIDIDLERFDLQVLSAAVNYRRVLIGAESIPEYIEMLAIDAAEADALLAKILHPYSSFDRAEMERQRMNAALLAHYAQYSGDLPYRAWSMGCAGGEEAYAMAFSLYGALEQADGASEFIVHGTDLRADRISVARAGAYSEYELRGLARETLVLCTTPHLRYHAVKREIRKRVIFSVHDALEQAPLSDMQFITCLGVLPKLSSSAAEKLLHKLESALRPGGLLLTDSDLR